MRDEPSISAFVPYGTAGRRPPAYFLTPLLQAPKKYVPHRFDRCFRATSKSRGVYPRASSGAHKRARRWRNRRALGRLREKTAFERPRQPTASRRVYPGAGRCAGINPAARRFCRGL